jgi:hypothetical protein
MHAALSTLGRHYPETTPASRDIKLTSRSPPPPTDGLGYLQTAGGKGKLSPEIFHPLTCRSY